MTAAADALLVLWLVLLGADRVSLLDNVVPFVLTPFLVLTPIVIASEWLRRAASGHRIVVPGTAIGYAAFCATLVAVVLASVSMSPDPATSAARAMLLVAQAGGTLVVVVLAADRDDVAALFGRAAVCGIALFAAFNALTLAAWFHLAPGILHLGPVAVNLESYAYADLIPRLSGPVGDPNRTGWVLLFMAYLVSVGERRATLRRAAIALAAVLVLLTLSRSAMLAAFATLVFVAAGTGPFRMRIGSLIASGIAAAALLTVLLVTPRLPAPDLAPIAPLAERLSVVEGSAKDHFALLRRGLDEATSSVPHAVLGIGYGSSYLVLQDMFPGNRYGNFHSLYVTIFAESGAFALLLVLILLGGPLLAGGAYRPLIVGAAVFSVFYQATTEPAFWLALALAWSCAGTANTQRVRNERRGSGAQQDPDVLHESILSP